MILKGKLNIKQFNGFAFVIAVFRHLPPVFRQNLLQKLQQVSPVLRRMIDEFEFIYDDIAYLDDKSIQIILREIKEEDWLLAWKLSNEKIRNKLLCNLSTRKKEDFLLLTQNYPKVPKRQVVAKQINIALRIKTMLQQGKLSLHSKRYF